MVQPADQNEATQAQDSHEMTVDGCVCPQCFKPLKAPAVTDGPPGRYGIRLRSYAGMCFHCRQACYVVQFEANGKWLINSYRPNLYESGRFVGYGDWVEVNPLPEQPPVLTGPGGDYDTVPDPDYDPAFSAIQGVAGFLMQATNAIGQLLKAIEKLRHNGLDNRKH